MSEEGFKKDGHCDMLLEEQIQRELENLVSRVLGDISKKNFDGIDLRNESLKKLKREEKSWQLGEDELRGKLLFTYLMGET